ncbi:MAG: hypothetical protein Q7S89_01170 [bacterium]|nr:hypothetical protein [bacterium]
MLELLLAWSVEYQKFGWNAATIVAAGMALFGLIEAWGTWEQHKTIERLGLGDSVPVLMFSFFIAYMGAFVFYGVYGRSIAIIVTAVPLVIVDICVLTALHRLKGFTRRERVLTYVFLSAIPAMALLSADGRKALFLLLNLAAVWAIALQPIELWRTKNVGAVNVNMAVTYFLGTIFWIGVGFSMGDEVLKVTCSINLVLLGLTIVLWYAYRGKRTSES